MEAVSNRRRTRSHKAIELDATIVRVAIEQILALGWDNVSARKIADAAGVTIGAFYARYLTMPDLGRQLFEFELGEVLLEGLGGVVDAAKDPAGLNRALEPFITGEPLLVAALELVLASQWEEPLRDAIFDPVREVLRAWCDPVASGGIDAAIHASALALALGLLVRSSRSWARSIDLTDELDRHAAAFASPGVLTELDPVVEESSPLRVTHFTGTDEATARLLMAMVETIGATGYRRATIAAVCASLGVTTGFMFARFDTKVAMLLAAVEATWSQSFVQSQQHGIELAARYDRGAVEAAAWRETLHPALSDLRRFLLEVERLARVDATVMACVERREHAVTALVVGKPSAAAMPANMASGLALGVGLPTLALFVDEAWTLPFSTLTAALLETEPWADEGLWAEDRADRPSRG